MRMNALVSLLAQRGTARCGWLIAESRVRRAISFQNDTDVVVGQSEGQPGAGRHHEQEVARNRSFDTGGIEVYEEEAGDECHSLYFVLDFSHQYYIPFIILLGLVGNLLSCVVFLNTHLKMRSSSYYLAALATADFSFLFSLLLVWLNNSIGWRVFNKEGWCETVVYVSSVCSSLSVWLIVAFTVERFIAVQYPLHRPHMCTIARAKTIVFALVVLAMASHSYSFVTAGIVKTQDGNEMCDMKLEYLETMRIISIIDSIASLMAPLVLIIVMNTMIMRNLLRFSRRFGPTSSVGLSTETRCPSRERSDINLNQIPVSCIYTLYIFIPQYSSSPSLFSIYL